jgi:hypothetical protein
MTNYVMSNLRNEPLGPVMAVQVLILVPDYARCQVPCQSGPHTDTLSEKKKEKKKRKGKQRKKLPSEK